MKQIRGAAFPPLGLDVDVGQAPAGSSGSVTNGSSSNSALSASASEPNLPAKGPGLASAASAVHSQSVDSLPAEADEKSEEAPSANEQASSSSSGLDVSLYDDSNKKRNRLNRFLELLELDNMDMERLRKLSWSGVSPQVRSVVWQLLLVSRATCGWMCLGSSRSNVMFIGSSL